MTRPLSHFIRPFLILTLLMASSASAGVFLQLDARTETRAIDALVRFLPHADSTSIITETGTYAEVAINLRGNGKQMAALETAPPPGSMDARLELVGASGLTVTDGMRILLKPDGNTPTLMIEVQNGAVTQSSAAALALSDLENAQIMYQPTRGASVTADYAVDLVLTPQGFDGIEVRYRFHLLGALEGAGLGLL